MHDISSLRTQFQSDLQGAATSDALEQVRLRYLGRESGELTKILRSLKDLSEDERRRIGPQAQALKKEIEEALETKRTQISAAPLWEVDLSAPGRKPSRGHLHPLTLAQREINRIFRDMNFSVVESSEVESEHYNFDALNFAPGHPARDVQDTFFLEQPERDKKDPRTNMLLRTQVTAMQILHLERQKPPFQIIYPGRTFRNEASDSGHESNFYQIETMVVGKDTTFRNFRFILETFLKKFLGEGVEFRYRASYFPFTEPSVEVDVKYRGKWFEILGAGMVHQSVFMNAGYKKGEWQGFAFGAGLDRLTMIKYDIPDVRLFYSGDLRLIRQF